MTLTRHKTITWTKNFVPSFLPELWSFQPKKGKKIISRHFWKCLQEWGCIKKEPIPDTEVFHRRNVLSQNIAQHFDRQINEILKWYPGFKSLTFYIGQDAMDEILQYKFDSPYRFNLSLDIDGSPNFKNAKIVMLPHLQDAFLVPEF